MNDNETRVFENHAQDARVREVGEWGLPVHRTDRRKLPVDERQQSNNHRSAGGAVMDRANREAAQTPLKKGGGYWSRSHRLQLVRRREQPSPRGWRLLHVAVLGRALPRGRDLGGVTCETE